MIKYIRLDEGYIRQIVEPRVRAGEVQCRFGSVHAEDLARAGAGGMQAKSSRVTEGV